MGWDWKHPGQRYPGLEEADSEQLRHTQHLGESPFLKGPRCSGPSFSSLV